MSCLWFMRRASNNIESIILLYVVDGILCPKRRLLSTMTLMSLAMCGGAIQLEATTISHDSSNCSEAA
jgi:hypothetical protein